MEYDLHGEVVATPGKEFKMTGLCFKPYACCRWAQPAGGGGAAGSVI